MKTCLSCKEEKELEEFPLSPTSKDGHIGICKLCRKDRKPTENSNEKFCPQCNRFREKNEFPKSKIRGDGLNPYCKECFKRMRQEKLKKKWEENRKKSEEEGGEKWKTIPDFSNYEASYTGRIRHIQRKSLMKAVANYAGYLVTSLTNDKGKMTGVRFNRIIAKTWIPNPENKPTVNHKNKDRTDNRVENLEWCTMVEQALHRTITEPIPKLSYFSKKITAINNDTEINFNSISEGCEYILNNNLSVNKNIAECIHKSIQNGKEYLGYIWRYNTAKDYEDEIWKTWNDRKISNYGRIKDKYGYIKEKESKNKDNYLKISYNKKTFPLHRIVAELFIPNTENKPVVNHKDGNKHNNTISNLEWVSYSENQYHAHRTGLQPIRKRILQIDPKTGLIITIWNNYKEVIEKVDINTSCLTSALGGRTKTSRGYIWKYEE